MYTQKDFSHLLGMEGFSDTMLNNHFTLYKGYVDNSNKMIENLDKVEKATQEYYELKRRLGWEINGIKLHELYFGNLVKGGSVMGDKVKEALSNSYGSIEEWENSIKRNGTIRGIGWVVLIQDNDTGKIFHEWVGEHNIGNIINADILLVMDMWEHAFITDYQLKKADYITAFMKNIDWSVVEGRMK
ncbi:MAG: superoxide dismutase, Fe-Mn family [Patescibacteria group bacterium]|nr:superoxide dismutase, Fe-Mn family [Patescibacteria group bacterium]